MSWSWIVATVLIVEVAAFFTYGMRWNTVRGIAASRKSSVN